MKYLIILGIIILAWCPWLSKEEAMNLVTMRIAQMEQESENLCAMFIYEDSVKKVPFGYTEKVSYDCALTDKEYGIEQSKNIVFITFYKGLLGMPRKTVER